MLVSMLGWVLGDEDPVLGKGKGREPVQGGPG